MCTAFLTRSGRGWPESNAKTRESATLRVGPSEGVDKAFWVDAVDEFGFGLGGVEIGSRRPLLPGLLLRLVLIGAASGRSLCGLRFCDRNSGRLGWNRGCLSRLRGWGRGWRRGMSFRYRCLVSGRRLLLSSGSRGRRRCLAIKFLQGVAGQIHEACLKFGGRQGR